MEKFYTVKEVSNILKVAELTIRRKIKEKKLKAYKVERQYRISESDLEDFMNNSKVN